jgi:hypothetical protein
MSRWWGHRRARLEARSSTDPDGRTFSRCGGTAYTLPSEGSGLTAMQVRLLSPGPIYRDVAELVYATGREPAGGNLMRVQIPSSRPFFCPAGVKARISTATAPKPRLFVGAIPTPGTIVPWLESVYTTASKSVARKGVWARIPPGRPISIAAWRNSRRASLRNSCPFPGIRVQPPWRRPPPCSSKRTARLIAGIALDQCQVLGALPTTATNFALPCKRRQRRPWPVPRRGRRTSGAGLHSLCPRSSVIRAHPSEG